MKKWSCACIYRQENKQFYLHVLIFCRFKTAFSLKTRLLKNGFIELYLTRWKKSIVFKSSNKNLGMKEANIKWYMYQKFPCIHQYKILGKIINVSACIHFIIYLVALMVIKKQETSLSKSPWFNYWAYTSICIGHYQTQSIITCLYKNWKNQNCIW